MYFHTEHIDADGKLVAMAHNMPTRPNENVSEGRKTFARLFGILVAKKGWTKPQMWHPDFPNSERMKRINHVENVNGNKPRYSDEQIANADKPRANIVIANFDKDGKPIPSLEVPPLGLTLVGVTESTSPLAANVEPVPVEDMDMGAPAAPVATPAVPQPVKA